MFEEFTLAMIDTGEVVIRTRYGGSGPRCCSVLRPINWVPCQERVFIAHARTQPDEVRILLWHLHRARERVAGLQLQQRSGQIIHGDFAPWNLRFHFELAHRDHRIADFALAWRGKYDAVTHGYHEVSPLEPEEWALLTPMWWAWLIDGAYQDMRNGIREYFSEVCARLGREPSETMPMVCQRFRRVYPS